MKSMLFFGCLLSIILDVTGREPIFSAALALLAGLWGGFVLIKNLLKKEPRKAVLEKLKLPSLLFLLFPTCVCVGLVFDSLALRKAEDIRLALLSRGGGGGLYKEFSEICSGGQSKYCGIFTYQIIPGESANSKGFLLVMQFFDKRVRLDIETGKISPIQNN